MMARLKKTYRETGYHPIYTKDPENQKIAEDGKEFTKLKEIRNMAKDLRNGVFHSEDAVNALIDGIIYRVDELLKKENNHG